MKSMSQDIKELNLFSLPDHSIHATPLQHCIEIISNEPSISEIARELHKIDYAIVRVKRGGAGATIMYVCHSSDLRQYYWHQFNAILEHDIELAEIREELRADD